MLTFLSALKSLSRCTHGCLVFIELCQVCVISLRQRNWFSQTGHLDTCVYLATVLATAIVKMQHRDVETGGTTVCNIPLIAVVESVEVTHGS